MKLATLWSGTGHCEWEYILSCIFILKVITTIDNDFTYADITSLFNRDLLASGNRVFTKPQIYFHLIKHFDIVEETDDYIKLKFKIS